MGELEWAGTSFWHLRMLIALEELIVNYVLPLRDTLYCFVFPTPSVVAYCVIVDLKQDVPYCSWSVLGMRTGREQPYMRLFRCYQSRFPGTASRKPRKPCRSSIRS